MTSVTAAIMSMLNVDVHASIVLVNCKAETFETITSILPLCWAISSTQVSTLAWSETSTALPKTDFGPEIADESSCSLAATSSLFLAQKCTWAPSEILFPSCKNDSQDRRCCGMYYNASTIRLPIPLVPPFDKLACKSARDVVGVSYR